MTATNFTNAGSILILIHRIITRGLETVQARSKEFAGSGLTEQPLKTGFAAYVRSLATVLEGHHQTEDELAYPFLRTRLPEAPYDVMTLDHQTMSAILKEVEAAAGALTDGGWAEPTLLDLHRVVSRLIDIWRPHIGLEEQHFSVPALARAFEPSEHAALLAKIAQFGQEHFLPPDLILPFLFHNLSPADRGVFAGEFPPIVSQQLVPVAWKDQWAPMAPFLLT